MKTLTLAFALGLGFAAIACVKPVWVDYKSVPSGALITHKDGSGALGVTPFRSEYPWDQTSCLNLQGVRAIWLSGAQAVSNDQIVFCGEPGTEFGITLQRPPGYPRYDEDLAVSLEFQTLLEAQGQEPVLDMYRTMQQAQPGQTAIDTNINCRSKQIGNQVYSSCD